MRELLALVLWAALGSRGMHPGKPPKVGLGTDTDPIAEHMNDWEVHSLRGLITTLLLEVRLYARAHPEAPGATTLADNLKVLTEAQLARQIEELQLLRKRLAAV